MCPTELLEAGAILGSITAAWFAVVGWKLLAAAPRERPGTNH